MSVQDAQFLSCAEQWFAADCVQRPLLRRARFQRRLTASVAMISHVKSWSQLVQVMTMLLSLVPRKRRSQSDPTVDPAAIRGLAPT
jgi:hypothetical protein